MRRLDPQVVGARREDGAGVFPGGTEVARLALAELIGDQAWREAVRDYVAGDDAAEMIRSVLHLVSPWRQRRNVSGCGARGQAANGGGRSNCCG
jgi:hypothetical protein